MDVAREKFWISHGPSSTNIFFIKDTLWEHCTMRTDEYVDSTLLTNGVIYYSNYSEIDFLSLSI